MSNLEFAWPYAAILLLLLIPLGYSRAVQLNYLESSMALTVARLLATTKIKHGFRATWLVLLWPLLVLALMRPQLVGEPISLSRDGRNIMVVLDLSESMEA